MNFKKIAFFTLGCKVNTFETEALWNKLKEKNYLRVEDLEEADVFVINTCTVTQISDTKSKKIVRQIIQKKREKQIVCVMGCSSQKDYKVYSTIPGVDIIIGNEDKNKLEELIEEFSLKEEQIISVTDIMKSKCFDNSEAIEFSHTRAFLKIQDGCENMCSYCIVPLVRGPKKSRSKESTIELVTKITEAGYSEVVLSGIHTGAYGSENNYSLTALIEELIKIKTLLSLRLSSIEITELDDEFFRLLQNKTLAKHLHIPLQSGSDKILEAMNRKYTRNEFLEITKMVKNLIPEIGFSTDVMVGFPGETENDFLETVNLIKEVGFMRLHVFPYSKRENTKAFQMEDQVSSVIKKERALILRNLGVKLQEDFAKTFIGKILSYLPETLDENNYFSGYTTNYLRVIVKRKNNESINKIYKIKIDGLSKNMIIGSFI